MGELWMLIPTYPNPNTVYIYIIDILQFLCSIMDLWMVIPMIPDVAVAAG